MANKIYNLDRKRYKRKKNKRLKKYIYLCLILVVIIGGYYIVKNHQLQIAKARYGQIVDSFQTRGLIIRDEAVFLAPKSGHVVTKQKEGDRVNQGQKIIDIQSSGDDLMLYSQKPGIVSYASDGLENQLEPTRLDEINIKDFNSLDRNYSQLMSGNFIEKRQPSYRIVNNYQLYIMFEASVKESDRYHHNEIVFVRSQKINTGLIKARIQRIKIEGDRALMTVKLNRFVDQWLNIRWVEVEIIKDIYRGIIIPRKAVFTQPEGKGVLLFLSGRKFKFKKVKIEEGTPEKVVVTGLEIGADVVVNPEDYNYGVGGDN